MVRAESIVEAVHFQFSMDDPMSSVSLADRNTEIHVKIFEKKMQDWRAGVTPDMPQGMRRCRSNAYPLLMISTSSSPCGAHRRSHHTLYS